MCLHKSCTRENELWSKENSNYSVLLLFLVYLQVNCFLQKVLYVHDYKNNPTIKT